MKRNDRVTFDKQGAIVTAVDPYHIFLLLDSGDEVAVRKADACRITQQPPLPLVVAR